VDGDRVRYLAARSGYSGFVHLEELTPPNCSPRNNVIVAHGAARRPLVPGPLNAYEATWMKFRAAYSVQVTCGCVVSAGWRPLCFRCVPPPHPHPTLLDTPVILIPTPCMLHFCSVCNRASGSGV
jgi:hypothetical protein